MESDITDSNSFSWQDVNWEALRKMRARFLSFETAESTDYWHSVEELSSYDFTFAERIGWKWDTVLAELKSRGWQPPLGTLLDYGCGTGVAGRRVVETWPKQVKKLGLWDRSVSAMQFARHRAESQFPRLPVETESAEGNILVISHVLNELSAELLDELYAVVMRAEVVLWVEPGTAAVSRKLIEIRQRLLAEGSFRVVAPCPHAEACGLLSPGNERHWCHHFAKVPTSIFQDAGWGRFSKTLEVDLRAIPLSYLVLDRRPVDGPDDLSRVIGYPRHYKGFDKILSCQRDGVQDLVLQKRDAPDLHREMKKDPGSLYRLEVDAGKIKSGTRFF